MTRDDQIESIGLFAVYVRWLTFGVLVLVGCAVYGADSVIRYRYTTNLATSELSHATVQAGFERSFQALETYFTVDFQEGSNGWTFGVYDPPPGIGRNWAWAWPQHGIVAIGPDVGGDADSIMRTGWHEQFHLLGSSHRDYHPPGTKVNDIGGPGSWLTVYDVRWILAYTNWLMRPGWTPELIAADRLQPLVVRPDSYTLPRNRWATIDPSANDSGSGVVHIARSRRLWNGRPAFPLSLRADQRIDVFPVGRPGGVTRAFYYSYPVGRYPRGKWPVENIGVITIRLGR